MMRAVLDATNGLAVAVLYALTRLRDDAQAFGAVRIPGSFEQIAADIFARRTACERDFVLGAALLPTLEDRLLRFCGWNDRTRCGPQWARMRPSCWNEPIGASGNFTIAFTTF
jgi:hypothetical protein